MSIPFPQHSHQVAKKSGSNFYLSFGILPPDQKAGMYAAYAFSRLVDDAVDQEAPTEQKIAALSAWQRELGACYNGGVSHPVMRELAQVVARFNIPREYFLDLIEGMMMDLHKHRYQDFEELKKYCYHVAGTVGLICNAIFGREDKRAHQYALDLGMAFQLTNILRDVGIDADQGRIYLPLEELERFQCSEQQILTKTYSPEFFKLMEFQWDRAKRYFEKAHRTLSGKERRRLLAAEIMDGIYYRILKKIRRRHFHVFEKKITVSKIQKFAILLKAWIRSKLS
ncbi:MAG: squalene synthase HpnD [Deltaproteobacteria bacterium GWA2_50_8]|nr:MAG: squalene synthase HpnD [Deltaproteobacteria bacterium GWA2_50_8]